MEQSNIKLQRIGATVDEHNLWKKVKLALAAFICEHTESKNRPCPKCLEIIEPLAKPIARFATRAATGYRAFNLIGKYDGYASLGDALDLLFKDAHVTTDDALRGDNPPETQIQSPQQTQSQGTRAGIPGCSNG